MSERFTEQSFLPLKIAILTVSDSRGETSRTIKIRAGFNWPKPDKRIEFHRARFQIGDDGEPELDVYPSRSSAVLSSVAWSDGLIEIAPDQVIERGDRVDFLPFINLFQ